MDSPVINDHFSIHNLSNYKTNIDTDIKGIIQKYTALIMEYLYAIITDEYIIGLKNLPFILIRGFNTITHVFRLILYYTQNIDMAYFHGQKSYYLYIEFISQTTGSNNVFLQLTSLDAALFVYKKSIFDIKIDIRTNTILSPIDSTKIDITSKFIHCVKNMLSFYLRNISKTKYKTETYHHILITNIKKIITNLLDSKIDLTLMSVLGNYIDKINQYSKNNVYDSLNDFDNYHNKIITLINNLNNLPLVKLDKYIIEEFDEKIFAYEDKLMMQKIIENIS